MLLLDDFLDKLFLEILDFKDLQEITESLELFLDSISRLLKDFEPLFDYFDFLDN
jgi:hypothetical protein